MLHTVTLEGTVALGELRGPGDAQIALRHSALAFCSFLSSYDHGPSLVLLWAFQMNLFPRLRRLRMLSSDSLP